MKISPAFAGPSRRGTVPRRDVHGVSHRGRDRGCRIATPNYRILVAESSGTTVPRSYLVSALLSGPVGGSNVKPAGGPGFLTICQPAVVEVIDQLPLSASSIPRTTARWFDISQGDDWRSCLRWPGVSPDFYSDAQTQNSGARASSPTTYPRDLCRRAMPRLLPRSLPQPQVRPGAG